MTGRKERLKALTVKTRRRLHRLENQKMDADMAARGNFQSFGRRRYDGWIAYLREVLDVLGEADGWE